MKTAYPVVFTKLEDGFAVYVPDFPLDTQGDTLTEAIAMARDAIGIMGVDLEDDEKSLPTPSGLDSIVCEVGQFVSLVDVDFAEYRRAHENRSVRRNVTLPSWLDVKAEKAGINVSAVLQEALIERLAR